MNNRKSIASWSRADIKKLEKLVKLYGTDFALISAKLGK